MNYQEQVITERELFRIFAIEENHFNDFKAKDISGKNSVKLFLPLQMQVVVIFTWVLEKRMIQK